MPYQGVTVSLPPPKKKNFFTPELRSWLLIAAIYLIAGIAIADIVVSISHGTPRCTYIIEAR